MKKISPIISYSLIAGVSIALLIFWSATILRLQTTYDGILNVYFPPNFSAADPVLRKLREMSLDEKIGQILIVGFPSPFADGHIQKMIAEYHIGGVNLLARNVQGADQVKKLSGDLQALSRTPLFIGTDQEGGVVSRFKFLPELAEQKNITSAAQAEEIAFRRARELRELGVNMNFSPVADYVSDSRSYLYSRTFGADASTTGELAAAMVTGYARGGIAPVLKHFPGYGNVFPNPHTGEAMLAIEEKELEVNLIPFRVVISKGSVGAIMTAHVKIPIVSLRPATESSEFLTSLLRGEMGFQGVIITDDIEMASVGASPVQAAVDAIKAGADMIISTYAPETQIKIFDALKRAVASGEISEARITSSARRVLRLKMEIFGRI